MRILISIGVPRQQETGAAGVVLNHARELERLGHSVECWFLEDVLPQPAKSKRFEALIFATRVAKRILSERNKYDVVNLHAPWGCVYGSWRNLAHLSDAPPYVMTMQGIERRYVHAMSREARKGRALNFGSKNRIWHRFYHQTMYARSIRTADFGMVANREAWVWAELKYNRPNGTFWYVPNGVGEEFFGPREYPAKQDIRLLYVGSWIDRKGIYYLADAFALLARTNSSISLTVAGCQARPDVVKDYFAAECREHLSVLPLMKRADMPRVYAEHDIFVFPSLAEGMPLALLEAMASGMPIVTTWSSGMADVVEDGHNGLLIPPADAEALEKSVRQLAGSTELRAQLGWNAQQTMLRYTWQNIARKVQRVLAMAESGAVQFDSPVPTSGG
jgi:glycosyltransferase involved in cell wall biosynthesis